MSQFFINGAGSGPPGENAIFQINGDTGFVTGNIVTIFANQATENAGATVSFSDDGGHTTSTFNVTDAHNNTMIGKNCGDAVGTGNTFLGAGLSALVTMLPQAIFNTAVGFGSLAALTSGRNNVVLGEAVMDNITTGSYNIAIGVSAGNNYTSSETSNISIASQGLTGDNNVLRIGTQGSSTTPVPQVNKAFIAGIVSNTTPSGTALPVFIESTGQLGAGALSGSKVLIQSQTVSSAAEVDFTSFVNPIFSNYEIIFSNLYTDTDNTNLYMEFSTDNGITYLNSSCYTSTVNSFNSGGNGDFGGGSQNAIFICTQISALANTGQQSFGEILLYINGTVFPMTRSYATTGTGTFPTTCSGSGAYQISTIVVNAFRFVSDSNISGTFKLYGVVA